MTISWTRCSEMLDKLTAKERACLKKHRDGDLSACPDEMLQQFERMQIVVVVNGVSVLTEEGRLLALFA
ncbi:MAG: hypothetical protein JWN94_2540 [Betaproteobacteria bacterium]|nr:hypothetical protein [Betaproteobacteria bacterium]